MFRKCRGRKPKIDYDTTDKMMKSLYGHYKEREKPWSQLAKDWNLNTCDRTLERAFAAKEYYNCKACQKGYNSPTNIKKREAYGHK
jgi:hypothetical protein